MRIHIEELKYIYELINDKLLSTGLKEIELPHDYYWWISSDERENLNQEPEICIGSLEDDWSELKKLSSTKFVTMVDLDRFANILIAISEQLSKKQ